VPFLTSPAFGSFYTRPAWASVTFPLRALFLSAFQRFSLGELNFYFEFRQSRPHRVDTQ
jgi:hypothetical protein